jgi:adenosylcobinamide kinase / adenosylcobinamide-phosphate guanylyltransferase
MLTLILGGARSGKPNLVQKLAATSGRVVYIATAQPAEDAEMAARIPRHGSSRPPCWQTIEEPTALRSAVERAASVADTVRIGCLTTWMSNFFLAHRDASPPTAEDSSRAEIRCIAAAPRQCRVILVSNEFGCCTVPEAAVARAFCDAQGLVNQYAAEAADEVILTVARPPLYLEAAKVGS